MSTVNFTDDGLTCNAQGQECRSMTPLPAPRPMWPPGARANQQLASPTDRPSNVPSMRSTREDDLHSMGTAPVFAPPSKHGPTAPTVDATKSRSSRPLPQIPTTKSKQKDEPSASILKPSQPRYISSIAQMLPSQEHVPDTSTSHEKGGIIVHQDICCGNDDCILYPVTTLPSSILAYDDEMLYRELPATEPPFASLTIEVPAFSFEVKASHADFVTISDILEAIYQNRNYFDKQWFRGLYWAGERSCLQLHLTDTD